MKRLATSPEQVRLCEIAERSIIKECLEARGVDPAPYVSHLGKPVNTALVNKPVNKGPVNTVNKPQDRAAYMREYMRKRRDQDEGA
jgi:hypothetical protein